MKHPETMTAAEYRASKYTGKDGEAIWQERVKELAAERGWIVLLEVPDNGMAAIGAILSRRRMPGLLALLAALSGWPDLTLGHPEGRNLVFAEVKIDKGVVRENQNKKLRLLRMCGQNAVVWRPRDEADVIAHLEREGKRGATRTA